MSYFDDYIADGLCCEACGSFLGGDEPGYVRYCLGCEPDDVRAESAPKPKNRDTPRTVECVHRGCTRKFKGKGAMRQHHRAVHGEIGA